MSVMPTVITENPLALFRQFEVVEDPRIERHKKYPLLNILVFSFVAIMSDQQSWYEIYAFCEANLEWFSQYIDIEAGVPSHDTFRRVFSLLRPEQLEQVIICWAEEVRSKDGQARVVVLDGKSLRGVAWKLDDRQLHILNAWDATKEQFLGQITIGNKTNEITAAPKLLKTLNLKGAVVTVDAMMTQREIASVITSKEGDYVMALKGNQRALHEDVKLYFSIVQEGMSSARSVEKNRGRLEIRTCTVASSDWINGKENWKGLNTVFRVENKSHYEGIVTGETRYYITSLQASAVELLNLSRKHWSIENSLHRSLDVTFKEDSAQEHNRNAAANMSILRKVALSMLKAVDPHKKLKLKMKESAYSPAFRHRCLSGKF